MTAGALGDSSAVLCDRHLGKGRPQAFQAFLRPDLFNVVILFECESIFWQLNPGHFVPGVDVDIGLERVRVVESPYSNESDLRATAVIAPDGHLAMRAAVDVMSSIIPWDRHGFRFAPENIYG